MLNIHLTQVVRCIGLRFVLSVITLIICSQYTPAAAGVYIGGNIGAANTQNTSSGINTSETASRVYLGIEYADKTKVADYTGFELAFIDYGKHNNIDLTGITLRMTQGNTLSPHVDVLAGLGAILWDAEDPLVPQINSGTDISFIIGLRFRFHSRLSLQVNYENNFSSGRAITGNNEDSLDVQWLGLNYHF